ncbi:hypothetical protein [Pseudodesulfovibrio pelocollis]|uniref:hypothetical protein n=1 Tax=Pseudodesulfovibrio pelocollis TaxID=3051432 RepID=UPI00255AF547|nr:hypothetical protein [Pseudodesulfovibrio sp. SB368]
MVKRNYSFEKRQKELAKKKKKEEKLQRKQERKDGDVLESDEETTDTQTDGLPREES